MDDDVVDPNEAAEDTENFLLGGAGGLRRTPPRGVLDREPGIGVREDPAADMLDADDPGRSIGSTGVGGWSRVKD